MVVLSVTTSIVSILLERYAIGFGKINEKFLDKSEYVCFVNEILIYISHQSIIYSDVYTYCVTVLAIYPKLIESHQKIQLVTYVFSLANRTSP